jgi:transcriptional regulator with XRE-family HTH domain
LHSIIINQQAAVTEPIPVEQGAERRVSLLLKNVRKRIAPEQESLGPYTRIPQRVGKPVTQEELAEAVGICREWYGLLESGRSPGVSSRLLSRLADVLMLDSDERAELLRLLRPELRPVLQPSSLEMVPSLRSILKPLWAATSEFETLQIVLEFGQTLFRGTDLAMSTHRLGFGRWEVPVLLGSDQVRRRLTNLAEMIMTRCDDSEIDQWCFQGLVTEPGDTVVFSDIFSELAVAKTIPDLERLVGRCHSSVLVSHVRSRKGYEGNVVIGRTGGPYDFSSSRVSIFRALADLTSLALST